MRTYLIKRLFMTFLVLVLVTIYLTLLVYIVPGDPAKSLLGPRANPDLIAKVRAAMNLDKPVLERIGLALWSLVRLDLGQDIFTGRPISMLVGAALPHTLILSLDEFKPGGTDRYSAGSVFFYTSRFLARPIHRHHIYIIYHHPFLCRGTIPVVDLCS